MQKHRPSRQARSGSSVETSAYKVCRSTDRAGRRDQVLLPLPSLLRTMYRSRRLFLFKKSSARHAVAPPLPKKSLTFRGPHKFAAQPCGFEPFFFCCLSLAHGLFCRILIPKTGADFPSGGIRLQRFRLLHHQ